MLEDQVVPVLYMCANLQLQIWIEESKQFWLCVWAPPCCSTFFDTQLPFKLVSIRKITATASDFFDLILFHPPMKFQIKAGSIWQTHFWDRKTAPFFGAWAQKPDLVGCAPAHVLGLASCPMPIPKSKVSARFFHVDCFHKKAACGGYDLFCGQSHLSVAVWKAAP